MKFILDKLKKNVDLFNFEFKNINEIEFLIIIIG